MGDGGVELVQSNRVVQNTYDKIGQLARKDLGHKRNASGSYVYAPSVPVLDVLNYSYNIRGWLKGINKEKTATNVTAMTDTWFAMELSYDWGFGTNQYNGNIAGVTWRTQGDDKDRSFGFTYDMANRLKTADFNQYNAGWSTASMDFSITSMGYDANGNITSLNQQGMQVGAAVEMDKLAYTYLANSNGDNVTNKLTKVKDNAVNSNNGMLGDFKDGTNGTNPDYDYDDNGNLTKDLNKKINLIEYNHLNLPWKITVTGKGTITYIYDAAGNKLEKRTSETIGGVPTETITTYLSGFVYQQVTKNGTLSQNPALQYFGHEEGRVREMNLNAGTTNPAVATYIFDYFEKDHLGNVRVVLTDELKKDVYPTLDFEGGANSGAVANQNATWDDGMGGAVDVANTRTATPGAMGAGSEAYVKSVMKTSPTANAIGAAKLLKVMAGDKLNVAVDYYYPSGSFPNSNANGYNTLVNSLVAILSGSSDVSAPVKGGTAGISSAMSTDPNVASVITQPESSGSATAKPKAYLHILFFDERFVFDNTSSVIVQATTPDAITSIVRNNVTARRNGYAYIYVSNESNALVYFDNLKLTHTHGPLIQETHYSAFGLTMAGISSKALSFGGAENKRLFNDGNELQNQEFSDSSGLEMYDATFRMYDAQIGRFSSIDMLADVTLDISPYAYCNNNPILLSDPLGLMGDTIRTNTPDKTPGFNTNDPASTGVDVVVTSTKKPNSSTSAPTYAFIGGGPGGGTLLPNRPVTKPTFNPEPIVPSPALGIFAKFLGTAVAVLWPSDAVRTNGYMKPQYPPYETQESDQQRRLALGVDEYLEQFAAAPNVQALPYKEWGADQPSQTTADAYSNAIRRLGMMPNVTFHFLLSTPRGRLDTPLNLRTFAQRITTVEFRTIMSSPLLRSKTTFYEKNGSNYNTTQPKGY